MMLFMKSHAGRLALLIGIFWMIHTCIASAGDQQIVFKECVHRCSQAECPAHLPFMLRLLRWTCTDNCRYECMQTLTERALRDGTQVFQYNGKWPFHRLWGMQEPASVLFSIGNGLVHYRNYERLRVQVPSVYFLKPFMVAYAVIGMNAWVWSTVFHARDKPMTEKLDYFSAGLLILYSLYFAILRIFCLRHTLLIRALAALCLTLFALHVGYLSLIRFDYGYNMAASVVVGVLQLALWLGWCAAQYVRPAHAARRSYAHLVAISVLGGAAAMSLELFDFVPVWRVFDAHSLWHLATIPITAVWYRFILCDTAFELNVHTTREK